MDYSNFKIDMPNDVEFIINTIKSHGHQAYAVGGCVRDSIMGLTPNDWDITTSALPSDIKEYEAGLFRYLDTDAAGVDVMQTIRTTGKLEKETEEKLVAVLNAYTEQFSEMKTEK